MTNRNQSKPPEALARLIELVNGEPELPDISQLLRDAEEQSDKVQSVGISNVRIRTCSEVARKLSDAARVYLGPPAQLQDFLDRYGCLYSASQALAALADQNLRKGSSGDYVGGTLAFVDVPFPVGVNFYRNKAGLIAASGTFMNALLGARADHIRRCKVCAKLFWAARQNSECCSEKCRKTFNQRNSRENRKIRATKKIRRRLSK